MEVYTIYTIGFTKKNAATFFGILKQAGIRRLVDVRLNNSSQLARFAQRDDLPYFLREICGADYLHMPLLAPTQTMLDTYKKSGGSWDDYAEAFLTLMRERRIETTLGRNLFEIPSVLLCSEHTPEQCHRRLVAEYLRDHWGNIEIVHL